MAQRPTAAGRWSEDPDEEDFDEPIVTEARPTGPMTDRQREAYLADIYHRHSSAVMGYALRRTSHDEAADVVSETFIVTWRRLEDVPAEPATKPWLLGVARRVLANQHRGRRRRNELSKKVATYLTPRFQHVPSAELTGEAMIVAEALEQLSDSDRELLTLVAWDELTPAEIAVTVGAKNAQIRKRLFRARKRLSDAIEKIEKERPATSGHLSPKEQHDDPILYLDKGAVVQ